MKYKIIEDVNISGKRLGDEFEAEPHAVELYLQKKQIEEVKEVIKPVKVVKKPVKKVSKKVVKSIKK